MSAKGLRLQRIEAKAFKAFRQLDFELDGRHLLAYGGNGAGKSSLYWLLYTFLQSAAKDSADATKYFEVEGQQNLLNVHATSDEQQDAHITISLRQAGNDVSCIYSLSATNHDTHKDPEVIKSNLASDFVTYRVLASFYQFRNSQAIDLWPVVEQEILPFAQGTSTKDICGLWRKLLVDPFGASKASKETAWRRRQRYEQFDRNVRAFNRALGEVLDSISQEAQKFYDQHFADPQKKIEIKVGITKQASSYDRYQHQFKPPQVGFELQLDGQPLRKPQSFLNEAKLTQLALSVRFGATLAHLHDASLKLLVLDDLLISLDMSNRMKVVDIILSDTFAEHQKIVLTHDLGFFNEFRRCIGSSHTEWSFQRFTGAAETEIELREAKSELQRAEDHILGYNLDEAAVCLRKAAENVARNYRERKIGKLGFGEFVSLTQLLREARKKLLEGIPVNFYEKALKATPQAYRSLLLAADDSDLDNNASLTLQERGILKTQRRHVRNALTDDRWAKMEAVSVVDRVLEMTERVLNPASHGSTTPLYEEEVRRAKKLIERLEHLLGAKF